MRVRHSAGLVSFEVEDSSPVVREILIREAEQRLAKYPQYAGYFEDAFVVRAKRDVRTRAGVVLRKGMLALAKQDATEADYAAGIYTRGFVTIHSPITGFQHSVSERRDVERV